MSKDINEFYALINKIENTHKFIKVKDIGTTEHWMIIAKHKPVHDEHHPKL